MSDYSEEKLKNVDNSRFQTGYKGGGSGQDSDQESSQGMEKEQEEKAVSRLLLIPFRKSYGTTSIQV